LATDAHAALPAESKRHGSIAGRFSIRRVENTSATPRSPRRHQPGRLHGERWMFGRPRGLGSASINVNLSLQLSEGNIYRGGGQAACATSTDATAAVAHKEVKSSRSILSSCRASARQRKAYGTRPNMNINWCPRKSLATCRHQLGEFRILRGRFAMSSRRRSASRGMDGQYSVFLRCNHRSADTSGAAQLRATSFEGFSITVRIGRIYRKRPRFRRRSQRLINMNKRASTGRKTSICRGAT